MAHIWTGPDVDEWHPIALASDVCAITPAGSVTAVAPDLKASDVQPMDGAATAPEQDPSSAVLLLRVSGAGDDTWALLAGPLARPLVNGLPVPLGLVVLSDRDEIRWPAPADRSARPNRPLFFSTERLVTVAPYPSDARRGSCPRCKQPLTPGDAAVRCPGCRLWHHATEALPCWTYGEQCAACPQPTSLDAGFQWTPEDL